MRLKVNFREIDEKLNVKFQEIHEISDGGYDKGYNDGYDKGYGVGNTEGYDKGYEVGYGESYDKGFDKGFIDGEQAEYDRFWDSYQQNGNRTDYNYAFAGIGWNDETFKPKYDINAKDLSTGFMKTQITDLAGILKARGVKLNTEGCKSLLQCFQSSKVTHIPEIDARSSTNMSYTFSASIKRIDKLKVSATTPFNNTFSGTLEYIIFEGEIGQNGLSLRRAQLPKESYISIINCLSTTTSGLSVTLDKNAINKAFETSEGANDGSNSTEWQTLVATKTNWTINLG